MIETHVQSSRQGHTLVVLEVVAWINLRVKVASIHVHDVVALTQIKSLAHAHEFAILIGFKTRSERRGSSHSLDVDHATGEVAILHAGDATHNLHTLDVVGRDGAHVHTTIGHVALAFRSRHVAACARHVLHVGITIDWSSIYHKQGAERTYCIVLIVALRPRGGEVACLTQLNGVHASHVGSVGNVAWQEFEQVAETGGLQVRHGITVDARGACQASLLFGSYHHLVEQLRIFLKSKVKSPVLIDGYGLIDGFIANERDL